MAITNTDKTAALQTKTYAASIAGRTARIADAHEIIQTKAILMGLSVQKGEGDSNRGGSSAITLADSHKIMDTASAINSINIQEYLEQASSTSTGYLSSNQTLNANGSVYIPVGYNKNPFTITAASLAGQTAGTASAGTIISGKTAWVGGSQIEGTLPLNKILDSYSTTDAAGNNVKGTVPTKTKADITGNATGVYDPNNLTVEVKRVNTPEDGTTELTNSITIPAGYYASPITIKPVVTDADGNVETTLNYGGVTYSGDLTFASGKYTAYPKDTNKDYISSVEISQHVAGTKDSTTGAYNVTTGGWINAGATYGGLGQGAYNLTTTNTSGKTDAVIIDTTNNTVTLTKKTHGYTPDSLVAALPTVVIDATNGDKQLDVTQNPTISNGKASYSKEITIPAGYYASGNKIVVSGEIALSTINGTHTFTPNYTKASGDTVETTEITSQYVKDSLGAGYYASASNKIYKIQSSTKSTSLSKETPTLSSSAITVSGNTKVQADHYYVRYNTGKGWTDGIDFIVDLGKSTHVDASQIALNTAGTAYEASCTSTAGYTTGETVKINIGKSTLTPSGVSYSNGKFTASATTTAGYTVGETKDATAFSVTEKGTTIDKNTTVGAKSYFPSAATVAAVAGVLADGSGANSNIGNVSSTDDANTATTKLGDLTKDSTFTAASNQYYTSFKIEVEDTIAALSAI